MRIKRTVIATAGIAMLALATSCSFFKYEEEQVIPTNCSNPVIGESTFTCGGQTYRTFIVGEQTWMAENLNYAADSIGNRCYDDDPANCNTYGRLYNWETAKKSCPEGWRLPSYAEWAILNEDEGEYFKSEGGRGDSDGSFYNVNYGGYWWSATEYEHEDFDGIYAYIRGRDRYGFNPLNIEDKSNFFSVRCLR